MSAYCFSVFAVCSLYCEFRCFACKIYRVFPSFSFFLSVYWIINARHWCVQPLPHPCAAKESHCFVYHFIHWISVWTRNARTHTRLLLALRHVRAKECGMSAKFLSMMQRGFKMLINNSIGSTMGYSRCCRHMENMKQTELEPAGARRVCVHVPLSVQVCVL